MLYYTGVHVDTEYDQVVAVGATWPAQIEPHFSTKKLTLPFARKTLPAVVIVQHTSIVEAVDAICHRTVEQIMLHARFRITEPPKVSLLVLPALAKNSYQLPCQKTRGHWLVTAASDILFDWLRGIHR